MLEAAPARRASQLRGLGDQLLPAAAQGASAVRRFDGDKVPRDALGRREGRKSSAMTNRSRMSKVMDWSAGKDEAVRRDLEEPGRELSGGPAWPP